MKTCLSLCVLCVSASLWFTNTRPIENPKALSTFFNALNEIKSQRRVDPVRIMHFGDSHIAADVLTRQIRERFQNEFGDGGPGFIVPKNPMSTRRRGVSSSATDGWTIAGIGGRSTPGGFYGPAGICLTTNSPGERAWIETSSAHFEIHYLQQPRGGTFEVMLDGERASDEPIASNATTMSVEALSLDAPPGVHRLEIRTLSPNKVTFLGFVAEQISPGVSYDVFGINGARASRMLSWNESAFVEAVKVRNPDLIILSYGTNEVADGDWTPVSYRLLLTSIIKRLRTAAPNASILITAPPERGDVPLLGRFNLLVDAQRAAARDNNVAFWSAYDAMGGAGSMNAWLAKGLAQPDRVHLTTPGYTRLANSLYQDLINSQPPKH